MTLSDVDFRAFAKLNQLQALWLFATPIGDADLKEFIGLQQLQKLICTTADNVSDVGLKELTGLKQLQHLNLDTQVTDMGVVQLQKALPLLTISR